MKEKQKKEHDKIEEITVMPIRFFNIHANSGPRRFVEYRNTTCIHDKLTN